MKIKKSTRITLCPLCGKTKFINLGVSKCPVLTSEYHLEKCVRCGLVFVNPTPNEKELSKIYTEVYRFGENSLIGKLLFFYSNISYKADAAIISKKINKGKVLDIGYGNGAMLGALKGKWEKYGYDPYSMRTDRIRIGKTKGIKASKSLEVFRKGSFDLIILRNVIEHTMIFKKLLGKIYYLLKPGGIVFIRTPNIESLDFKVFGTSWYMTYMGGHLVFFNQKSLKRLLKSLDFTTVKVRSTRLSPPFSFKRSMELAFSINSRLISFVFIPFSILYSLLSTLDGRGNDLIAIFKK